MVLGYADKKFLKLLGEIKAKRTCIGRSKETTGNAYRITLTRNKKRISFYYHDNFKNMGDISDWLYALIVDSDCYEQSTSWFDFMVQFGYDRKSDTEVKKIYYACKRNSERLHKLFTDTDIQLMRDNIQ